MSDLHCRGFNLKIWTTAVICERLKSLACSYNRQMLEKKAKLYEQMTKGDFPGQYDVQYITIW